MDELLNNLEIRKVIIDKRYRHLMSRDFIANIILDHLYVTNPGFTKQTALRLADRLTSYIEEVLYDNH